MSNTFFKLQYEDKEELVDYFKDCDIIIYNITEDKEIVDEAVWAVSHLNSELDSFETQKMFVLISTCLTWASTKPMDPVSNIKFILCYYLCFILFFIPKS